VNINNKRQDKEEDIPDEMKVVFSIKENARQGFISNGKDLEN